MTVDSTSEAVMPQGRAEQITAQLVLLSGAVRESVEKIAALVDEARRGNAHVALGYQSWTAYLSDTLGQNPIRLDREGRREIVGLLAGQGMSTRDIAPIVGAGHVTVSRDLATVPNETVLPPTIQSRDGIERPRVTARQAPTPPTPATDAELIAGADWTPTPPFNPTTGEVLDTPTPPATNTRRKPITDTARDAGWELRRAIERLNRLTEDDRFDRNTETIAPHLQAHLTYTIETCESLLARLTPTH